MFDWAGSVLGLKNLNWPFPYCDDVAVVGGAGDGAGENPPDPASCPDASCAVRTGANYYSQVLVGFFKNFEKTLKKLTS